MRNNFDWRNKTVVITGSSIGIGKRLAVELGKKGATIILNGRREPQLKQTQLELEDQNIKSFFFVGDVSKIEDCEKLMALAVEKCGGLDYLINNAGLATISTIENLNPAVFKQILEVNVLGCFNTTKVALPEIRKTKGGILFIGSIAGIYGIPEYAAYSCSKSALKTFVESLQIEVKGSGLYIGHAFVGFTENDKAKTFLNQQGEKVPLPARDSVKQMPVEELALGLVRMMERRQTSYTFTFTGKLFQIVNRIAPGIARFILSRNFHKSA